MRSCQFAAGNYEFAAGTATGLTSPIAQASTIACLIIGDVTLRVVKAFGQGESRAHDAQLAAANVQSIRPSSRFRIGA
jgi:hypothetical protein